MGAAMVSVFAARILGKAKHIMWLSSKNVCG